ncbi:hypothetical protein T4D_16115, partial [Trichinella pseudospiralis]
LEFHKDKEKRSSFIGILQGEAHSMAFYKGLIEKNKIKRSEARSLAFYKGLSEKSKVRGDDFKNR